MTRLGDSSVNVAEIAAWCGSYTGEKFHGVLCDPPYHLVSQDKRDHRRASPNEKQRTKIGGFMGQAWDGGDVAFRPETWAAIYEHLHPGAHLLAFGGTRTFHRLTCAIEDAGFEIRDCLMWVYGSGFPKSHNLKDEWHGYGTALKPAWEPVIVARKPLDGTVAENVQKWGCGAINVDGCRVPANDERSGGFGKGKRPWVTGGNGETIKIGIELGRWPANLIHDGSQMVMGLFPNSDSGSAARFFYCAKSSKRERDAGCEGMEIRDSMKWSGGNEMRGIAGSYPDGTPRPKQLSRNHHPTVKPLALTEYLARLILPATGGRILVPFSGSGSEMIGAMKAGWDFVQGVEREAEYAAIAEARLRHFARPYDRLGDACL